jgi:hypothetical protein
MIASAVIQTILLLCSGSLNVFISPGSLSVEKQLFVSSVILMIGFAQGVVLLLFKVIIRICTGIDIRFGCSYLFSPLTTAMQNAVNDRPGETAVYKDNNISPGNNVDLQPDEDDTDTIFSHFIPEQEVVVEERRNIYTDVYLLGIAAFTATYCIDTVSPAPTTAFVSGLLIMSIIQSVNILVILSRSTSTAFGGTEPVPEMHAKRILTVTSCFFATSAFVMFCTGMLGADVSENKENSSVDNIFDFTFSVVLPLISPWLLVTVSPKQQPLRTLFECTPFVFTICSCFVLFFVATRGEISTILHQLDNDIYHNVTQNAADLEFHSDVNASIHFNLDFFTTASVDSAGNIPMLLCAPLIKIPTMVVVLANVMNRSNLVVITSLLVTMSIREISNTHTQDSSHRAYCVALGLSGFALVFNVLKYLHVAPWLLAMRQPSPIKPVEDVKFDTDIDTNL